MILSYYFLSLFDFFLKYPRLFGTKNLEKRGSGKKEEATERNFFLPERKEARGTENVSQLPPACSSDVRSFQSFV